MHHNDDIMLSETGDQPPSRVSERGRSKPKFAVRTKTHQIERVLTRLPVDENQIGFEVAIPVVFPFAGQGMVMVAFR